MSGNFLQREQQVSDVSMIYARNWVWGLIWACLYELWEQLIEVSHTDNLQVQFHTATQHSQVANQYVWLHKD